LNDHLIERCTKMIVMDRHIYIVAYNEHTRISLKLVMHKSSSQIPETRSAGVRKRVLNNLEPLDPNVNDIITR
jgi:hypothetical protein